MKEESPGVGWQVITETIDLLWEFLSASRTSITSIPLIRILEINVKKLSFIDFSSKVTFRTALQQLKQLLLSPSYRLRSCYRYIVVLKNIATLHCKQVSVSPSTQTSNINYTSEEWGFLEYKMEYLQEIDTKIGDYLMMLDVLFPTHNFEKMVALHNEYVSIILKLVQYHFPSKYIKIEKTFSEIYSILTNKKISPVEKYLSVLKSVEYLSGIILGINLFKEIKRNDDIKVNYIR